ncbi:hypothetical protein [Hoeflea sp.]|uniref:hypothetical protein n=1 Tax=Hoeflea sp. TaxID=1940281 RepID=UPI003B523172
MSEEIHLQTFGDLVRYGYNLAGWCRPCGRHEDIDLTKLPADRGYVSARFRCKTCGGLVGVTLSQIATSGDNSAYHAALDKWRKPQ